MREATAVPKRLTREMSATWFLERRTWRLFMVRELTCLFVGWFAFVLLRLVRGVAEGPEAYLAFQKWLESPGMIALHIVAFIAVLFHTVTWFQAAPKAMRPTIGDERVPPALIVAGHWGGWVVVSAVILLIFLGKG